MIFIGTDCGDFSANASQYVGGDVIYRFAGNHVSGILKFMIIFGNELGLLGDAAGLVDSGLKSGEVAISLNVAVVITRERAGIVGEHRSFGQILRFLHIDGVAGFAAKDIVQGFAAIEGIIDKQRCGNGRGRAFDNNGIVDNIHCLATLSVLPYLDTGGLFAVGNTGDLNIIVVDALIRLTGVIVGEISKIDTIHGSG